MNMLDELYTPWHLQGLIEVPSGFSPPFDTKKAWGDAREIKGIFIPDQTDISSMQFQSGRGLFVVPSDSDISVNAVLRSEVTGKHIKIITDPLIAPDIAEVHIKRFGAEVVEWAAEEEAALAPFV